MVAFKVLNQNSGYAVMMFVLSLPILLGLVTAAWVFLVPLALDMRISHRCRDEALAAQEVLSGHLHEMRTLNQRVIWAHRLYKLAKLGRVIPPMTGSAQAAVEYFRALKIALNLQQQVLLAKIRSHLQTRDILAGENIRQNLRKDFGLSSFTLELKKVFRLNYSFFHRQRLDIYSSTYQEREDLSEQSQVKWKWNFLADGSLLSKMKRQADWSLSGQCSSHLQKRGIEWNAILGMPGKLSWN